MIIGKPIKSGQTIVIKKSGNNRDIINALHKYMPYAVQQSKKTCLNVQG